MPKTIDLRSDTASLPSEAMVAAIQNAPLGDDILEEDPSVKDLENEAASLLGLDAALLTPSGTMSNQIAVTELTTPGQEVLLGAESHLYNMEVGGLAANAQVQARAVPVSNGEYDVHVLEASIRSGSIQAPRTGLICLENSYDLNRGQAISLDNLAEVRRIADRFRLPVFIDGARLFNAAEALGVSLKDICQYADAVQFCLNKGLSGPVGSILAGTFEFVSNARRTRQRLGGGMRQAGIIAAPGLEGLRNWHEFVQDDRLKLRKLVEEINHTPGITIANRDPDTNILALCIDELDIDSFVAQLEDRNILVRKVDNQSVRLVTHRSISWDDITETHRAINEILKN